MVGCVTEILAMGGIDFGGTPEEEISAHSPRPSVPAEVGAGRTRLRAARCDRAAR
ncbi:hypothetical protein GZL_09367 [Streptomyces sp. 769]|nr:hypothetical protein GZL_00046 [Streptomyces sp. 769]AJC61885.1 hypothetical protein GZL_09367 [Streptomyces sp. 769]